MEEPRSGGREIPAISGVGPVGLTGDGGGSLTAGGRPQSLDDWQRLIVQVFARNNAFMSPKTIWLRTIEQAGELAEVLRKEDYSECEDVLADLLAWVLAFANKVGIALADAVWAKYPGICPYCLPSDDIDILRRTPIVQQIDGSSVTILGRCTCGLRDYAPYKGSTVVELRRDISRKPTTLTEWQALFYGVYGLGHDKLRGPDAVAYHLQEEIAEVAREIRLERFQEAQEELADVFSWILCLASRLGRYTNVNDGKINMDEALWRNYPGRCKVCGEPICHCDKTPARFR